MNYTKLLFNKHDSSHYVSYILYQQSYIKDTTNL